MTQFFQTWRLLNLKLGIGEPESEMRRKAMNESGIDENALRGFRIARRSVDARRIAGRRRLAFNVHVDLSVDAG